MLKSVLCFKEGKVKLFSWRSWVWLPPYAVKGAFLLLKKHFNNIYHTYIAELQTTILYSITATQFVDLMDKMHYFEGLHSPITALEIQIQWRKALVCILNFKHINSPIEVSNIKHVFKPKVQPSVSIISIFSTQKKSPARYYQAIFAIHCCQQGVLNPAIRTFFCPMSMHYAK